MSLKRNWNFDTSVQGGVKRGFRLNDYSDFLIGGTYNTQTGSLEEG